MCLNLLFDNTENVPSALILRVRDIGILTVSQNKGYFLVPKHEGLYEMSSGLVGKVLALQEWGPELDPQSPPKKSQV